MKGHLFDIVMLSEHQTTQGSGVHQGEHVLKTVMPRIVAALNKAAPLP